jgi:hypothetical protein
LLDGETSYCDICDIVPTKLYDVAGKKVCRRCKKHYEESKKFIRKKVEHDFVEATKLLTRFHREAFGEPHGRRYKLD